MACLARPISCEHDVHVSDRMLDMFGREEMSVNGYPLLKCGCELVELPVCRVYKAPNLECNETIDNVDTVEDTVITVDEAIMVVESSNERQRREQHMGFLRALEQPGSRQISFLEYVQDRARRQHQDRVAMRGFLATGWSARLNVGQLIYRNPSMLDNLSINSVRVKIDWILLSRLIVGEGDVEQRRTWCVCSRCYNGMELAEDVQVVNHMYERMEVDMDENYFVHVGVDMLPQHYVYQAFGPYQACRFLTYFRLYSKCHACNNPLITVLEPDNLPWVHVENLVPIRNNMYFQNMSEAEFNQYFSYVMAVPL